MRPVAPPGIVRRVLRNLENACQRICDEAGAEMARRLITSLPDG
jgi:hypothetical protein